jgi:hypothetical protein
MDIVRRAKKHALPRLEQQCMIAFQIKAMHKAIAIGAA